MLVIFIGNSDLISIFDTLPLPKFYKLIFWKCIENDICYIFAIPISENILLSIYRISFLIYILGHSYLSVDRVPIQNRITLFLRCDVEFLYLLRELNYTNCRPNLNSK